MRNEEVTAERRWVGTAQAKRAAVVARAPELDSDFRRPTQRSRATLGKKSRQGVPTEPVDHERIGCGLPSSRNAAALVLPDGFSPGHVLTDPATRHGQRQAKAVLLQQSR